MEHPGVRATYLPGKPGLDRARRRIFTHLSLAQLAERETVVFTAISRSSVRLREGRPVKKKSHESFVELSLNKKKKKKDKRGEKQKAKHMKEREREKERKESAASGLPAWSPTAVLPRLEPA